MSVAQLNAAPSVEVEHVFPLPHAPRAASAVRRHVHTVLTGWNLRAEDAEDVLLVVSELLTNAIIHALPPARLRLSRVLVGGRAAVRVEVTDTGPAAPARLSAAALDPDEHGRGICIINALSARCGVVVHTGGTSRWAEVLVD